VRVLAVTKIFPNVLEPTGGPYNRQQLAALSRIPGVEVRVLATIPYGPGARLVAPRSATGRLAAVPRHEHIDGLEVAHPRTLFVPRLPGVGSPLYAASLLPWVLPLRHRVDVVFAAWAHPDGAGAVLLGKLLGVPVVVKLHGSDVNVVGKMPGPRRAMQILLPRADRVVAVSRALADAVAELGVPRDRIDVILNGVDGDLFRPRDRAAARAHLGLDASRRLLLYVGRLQREKGVFDLLEAFARIAPGAPEVDLAFVGDGPAQAELAAAAAPLGARVRLVGAQPLATVPEWMAACDALVLPSWNEGTPNVLLEALACGRRVVATRVGGCPDVVSHPDLGALVPVRDPAALAPALLAAARAAYDPSDVARLGARGGWADSAAALHETLRHAIAGRA
jgi:glycosyltransferase involved in cell wall biosynthesis